MDLGAGRTQEERLPLLAMLADVQLLEDQGQLEAKVVARVEEAAREAGGYDKVRGGRRTWAGGGGGVPGGRGD